MSSIPQSSFYGEVPGGDLMVLLAGAAPAGEQASTGRSPAGT